MVHADGLYSLPASQAVDHLLSCLPAFMCTRACLPGNRVSIYCGFAFHSASAADLSLVYQIRFGSCSCNPFTDRIYLQMTTYADLWHSARVA